MDVAPLRLWNTHWDTGKPSALILSHPEPRASVPYWVDDLRSRADKQWIIVAGPRQVGKTTGLGHAVQGLLEAGAPRRAVAVVPFDQPSIQQEVRDDLDGLIAALSDQHPPTTDEPLYLLLDEVQELQGWAKRLKAAWDRHRETVCVLATGSSALRLIRPADADFPGRIRVQTLHTMKFREVLLGHPDRHKHANEDVWNELARLAKDARGFFLDPKDEGNLKAALESLHGFLTSFRPRLEPFVRNVFQEYCVWGGYPRARPGLPLTLAERRSTFEAAWNAVLGRDLPAVGIQKPREFSQVFYHIARNPGGKFVPNALSNNIGPKGVTIAEWKRVLEDAMLVQQLAPLKANLEPTHAKEKAYLLDPGWYAYVRGVADAPQVWGAPDMGLLVETVLVDHARRLQYNLTKSSTMPIGYVEDPEVDVAFSLGPRWVLLEAKWRENPKRSLLKLPTGPGNLRVIATRSHFELPKAEGPFYIPAHEWALIA